MASINHHSRTTFKVCINCGGAFSAQGAYTECATCIRAENQAKEEAPDRSSKEKDKDKENKGKESKGKDKMISGK